MNMPFVKTVIINRAVPGSGKTTIARCITNALQDAGLQVANHSTDEFFMHDGRYCFDISKLHDYHQENLASSVGVGAKQRKLSLWISLYEIRGM